MNDITIKLNGKSIKLSSTDTDIQLAGTLAGVVIGTISARPAWGARGDYRMHLQYWRDFYEGKRDRALLWLDPVAMTRRRLLDHEYESPEGQERLRLQERIWTIRRLIAEEVLRAIEELMR